MLSMDRHAWRKVLDHFGKDNQTDKLIEEMAELTQALLRERQGRPHNVTEEMGDVIILLYQMMLFYDNEEEMKHSIEKKKCKVLYRIWEEVEKNGCATEDSRCVCAPGKVQAGVQHDFPNNGMER